MHPVTWWSANIINASPLSIWVYILTRNPYFALVIVDNRRNPPFPPKNPLKIGKISPEKCNLSPYVHKLGLKFGIYEDFGGVQ